MEHWEEEAALPVLVRSASEQKCSEWASARDVLEEFQSIAKLCCVRKSFMSTTKSNHVLLYLKHRMEQEPVLEFDLLLERCIRKAYSVPDMPSGDVRSLTCMIEGYEIFPNVKSMYNELSWRASYMHAAMRELYTALDEGCWIGVLAGMAKGGHECLGRKRFAFNSLLDMVAVPSERPTDSQVESIRSPSPPSEPSSSAESPVTQSMKKLDAYFQNFIDEFKLKALRSGMMEPLKLYLWGTGGSDLSLMNAEVHDVNWMAALLLAALQVQLPVLPYLMETNHTDHHYLALQNDDYKSLLQEMDRSEFFGYAFTATQLWKQKYQNNKPAFAKPDGETVWSRGDAQCRAAAAIDPQSTPGKREEVGLYLRRFMNFFRPEFLCEKLAVALTRDRSHDLEIVFQALKIEAGINMESPESDEPQYREWLWDAMSGTFRTGRALQLFAFAGLLRDDMGIAPEEDTPEDNAPNESKTPE